MSEKAPESVFARMEILVKVSYASEMQTFIYFPYSDSFKRFNDSSAIGSPSLAFFSASSFSAASFSAASFSAAFFC